MGDRFYLMEMVDLWMHDLESSPSKRTAGGKAANYLITGPGWKGTVPEGMKHIPIATRYMVILGRTYAGYCRRGVFQHWRVLVQLSRNFSTHHNATLRGRVPLGYV